MKQVKKSNQLLVVLLAVISSICILIPRPAYTAAFTSAVSGNWSNPVTWGVAAYPGQNPTADTVTIANTHTVTLDVIPANSLGSLTVGQGVSGILNDSGAFALTVNGPVTIVANGTINFGVNNSTLTITGGASNLTINGTYTDGTGNIGVGNNATVGAVGTFTPAAGNVTVGGNWILAGGGTFNAGASTVVFADVGNHQIQGTNTFNNLTFGPLGTARILTFPAGVVTNVGGTLTLLGTAGNILTLVSSTPGVQWTINPANYNIDYVDVADSNNTGATINVPVTTNTDSLNNTNWNFFTPIPTLTEWGMIIFMGLLILSSIVILKRRGRTASSVM